MKPDEKELYFIALTPPGEISEKATAFKNYFAEKFNSRHALKSPPHITLHMPFKWNPEKEKDVTDFLESFSSAQKPFEVRLNGFGSFPRRVIYIDVESNELLAKLYSDLASEFRAKLNIFNSGYKNEGFTAHITLAHRDLRPAAYNEAWQEFREKKFDRSFNAEKLALLKHNGKHWEILKEFPFLKPVR